MPTLTLQDIANLANVRRPVVSVWRNRPRVRGELIPFPTPVEVREGVERFDRDEVVEWISRTGRGNNDEVHLDAPAASEPEAEMEDLVTLLCLQAMAGTELSGTTRSERTDLARDVDPDDRLLLTEVRAVDATPEVLSYVDDLVEASYGVGEALERMERGTASRRRRRRALTREALDLVTAVAVACRDHLGPDGVQLTHEGGNSRLTAAVGESFDELEVPGSSADDRALRRRAVLRGLQLADGPADHQVKLLSVVGSTPERALDRVDNLVLELGDGQIGVVLGPAGVLCDGLRGAANTARSETLRFRRLVCALRLPRGWWKEAHRQALGLWVVVGGAEVGQPVVADLGAVEPGSLDLDDVAADVLGALAHTGTRAYRYGRPYDLALVLADRPVVPRGIQALRHEAGSTEDVVERIHAATLLTSSAAPGFDVAVTSSPPSIVLRSRSLGELAEAGVVAVRRGSRIHSGDADPRGTVAVLTADGSSDIQLDPIDAVARYPRAMRTEPGDVVFQEKPRPRAVVDERGGSLVASPSRLLRLGPRAGVGPHALAAIINLQPESAREWQSWSVPDLTQRDVVDLETVLVRSADYASDLERRLDAVRRLTVDLVDGMAAGAVTLDLDHRLHDTKGA